MTSTSTASGAPAQSPTALLPELLSALTAGSVRVVDLTNTLSADTPSLQLPEPFVNLDDFALEKVAAFDDRAPMWAHNNFRMGEHIGTHVDAPCHWITGRDGADVSELPPSRLVGPAVMLDFSAQAATDPNWCLTSEHVRAWESEHGAFPENCWVLLRTGWDQFAHERKRFLNADENGSHTPGITAECSQFLAERDDVSGFGVETVGIDAGNGASFEPPFPAHYYLLGADKYGVTSLQNLAQLPAHGAVIVVAPLPILEGTAAPARVFALIEEGA